MSDFSNGVPEWRKEADALPNFSPGRFEVDAASTALLLVDLQYVDAHPEYGLGAHLKQNFPDIWDYYFTRMRETVMPNCVALLDQFRAASMRVVHLTIGPQLSDGMDMSPLRRPATAPGLQPMLHHVGTFEHGILPEVTPVAGELVINKTSRSAFNSTAIEIVLRNLGVRTLVVVGVTTSSCVDTTARDAADRGFQVAVVEDAVAELDEPSHEAALRQFAVRWGRVWTAAETAEALSMDKAGTQDRKAAAR